MQRWLQVSFCCVLLLLAGGAGSARAADAACPPGNAEALVLKEGAHAQFIGETAWVLADPAGALRYDAVLEADRAGQFVRHCRADIEPLQSGGAVWLRLDVKRVADAPADWSLVFGQIEIDEVQLYQVLPGGLFVLKRSGRAVPPSARDTLARWPAVSVELDPDKTTRLYLRLSGITAPFVSARILPEKRFIDQEGRDLLMLAAVLGFMVAMLAYNLVIYVRSRLHQCLYYFLYLGFIIVNIVVYDGLIYRFADFTVSGHLADTLSQGSAVAAAMALLLFGRSLLRLSEAAPWASAVTLLGVGALFLSLVLESLGVLPDITMTSVFVILSGVFMCGCAIRFALTGHLPAIYFSLSYGALLAGVSLNIFAFYFPIALSPESGFWEVVFGVQQNWSFHIGVCAEAVLISFAITYFIKDMQADIAGANSKLTSVLAETEKVKSDYEGRLAAIALKTGLRERLTEKAAALFSAKPAEVRLAERAAEIVQAHLSDKNFDVKRLAGELAVSEQTLRRRLEHTVGLSPVAFIRRRRLEHAKHLLETRAHGTVAEVALAVGIATPGYFTRQYREAFGQSPADILRGGLKN